MARRPRSQSKETATAQVFLRSVSGRSLREIADSPLPADLAPFRPRQGNLDAAVRHFESLRFSVYRDEMGLSLTIQGTPALFARVFGIPAARLATVSAAETVRLAPPPEIQDLVEEIVLTPKPEFF